MKTIANTLIFGLCVAFGSILLGDKQASDGPVQARIETDRYAGHSNLYLRYDGYLLDCSENSSVVAHLIFHTAEGTRIFELPLGSACSLASWQTHPWQPGEFAMLVQWEWEPRHREFWSYLSISLRGNAVFEVAFERDGRWDSNYGRNFRLVFH